MLTLQSFQVGGWDGIKVLLLRQNFDWSGNGCGKLRLPQQTSRSRRAAVDISLFLIYSKAQVPTLTGPQQETCTVAPSLTSTARPRSRRVPQQERIYVQCTAALFYSSTPQQKRERSNLSAFIWSLWGWISTYS